MFSFQMDHYFTFPVRILCSDTGDLLKEWKDDAQGLFNLPSTNKKRNLVFEFDNSQSTMTGVTVNFEIHITLDPSYSVRADKVDPIESKVQELYGKMQGLRTLQKALRYKQKEHRTTVEATKERVLWWSIMQVVGFAVAAGSQLWLLQSLLEKRRSL
ncbi:emp24/gp25L/p24 family/GOLD, putative [Leishmania lindenbergi]|uniref:Emp24/gp25L/p24 family/GOLD n=1 Tax=Leishmania lindenbergi TaxID=651832 RepID=A0AAW3A1F1_9TRYP